jgi:putative membrane protein
VSVSLEPIIRDLVALYLEDLVKNRNFVAKICIFMRITEIEKYIRIVENLEIGEEETWIEGFEKDFLFKINSIPPKTYKNIHINEDINFQNENFEDSIIFNNIVFNKEILILFSTFKNYISFNNCTFEGNLTFGSCTFEKEVRFINCKFNSSIDFWRTSFKSIVDFSESHFRGEESIFRDSLFNNNVFYEKTQIVSKINFQNTIFEGNVYFEGAVLENIDFSGAKFVVPEGDKDTINKFQRKEINFSRVLFGTVSFENTLFEKNIRFHESTFEKEANFYNTSFKKLVDFYLVNFKAEQQFHLTDFLDRAIFSNVIFHKEVQFIYNKTEGNSYINFESATFKRGLDISRSNFNCNLNFWNVKIEKKGVEEIFDYLSNKATFKELKYIDDFGEHKEGAIPSVYKQIRESFRIIKNSFYAQNNRIEGLKFYEKEMSVYLEEKRFSKTKKEQKYKSNFYENFKDNNIFYVLLAIIVVSMPLWVYCKSLFFYITLIISFVLVLVERWYKNKEKLKTKNPLKQNNYFSFIFLIIGIIFYLIWIHEVMNTIHYVVISYIFLFFSVVFLYFYQERDRIILWLNKNSNSFGTDWVVGINFTLLIALISAMIILSMTPHIAFSFDMEGIENFIRTLVEILNITEWADIKILNKEPNTWQYILMFFSRIFIGYGYYQTIQAFRKFGKS